VDISANVVVVDRCAKQMGLRVCLSLRMLQLLGAG
jgi:hypothetical protein